MATAQTPKDDGTAVRTDVPLVQPMTLPDGTAILSGPMPGGQVAMATQLAPHFVDPSDLKFAGVPGGLFTVYGYDFGPVGMVFVGKQQVTVTAWQPHRIKGLLPLGIEAKQEVRVVDGLGKETKIPYAPPPIPQSQNAVPDDQLMAALRSLQK
jgi:hypothetical protein